MKRDPKDLIYPNFFETLLQNGHRTDLKFLKAPKFFVSSENNTVLTKRVFDSKIFQTLLEDKINGLY